MRWQGCKDGCFWTTVSSDTCAKAVCLSLSQRQHGVGCQGKPCGCDCPSQLWKILFSNFLTLKTIENFYETIKRYEELRRIENRAHSGCLKSVRALATIKRVQDWIGRNPLLKQKTTSRELNTSTQWMSCLIRGDQHMTVHRRSKGHILTPALKEIWWTRAEHLLQWHSESGNKNIFTIEEQYNHQNNKIYAQTSREVKEDVLRVHGGHHPSYVMVWWEVSHQGVTHFHFCKKGVKLVSRQIKRTCYKELWNILTWPSLVVRNGYSSRTQFLPKRPRQLRSGCGGTFWPSLVLRIGFWGVQTSNPWRINCGLFWRTWRAVSITTAWRAWRDPLWRHGGDPPRRWSMRRQQSGRSISRFASRHRAAILSDIIINENQELLQINYLAQKMDDLYNFPSRSHCTCNRTSPYLAHTCFGRSPSAGRTQPNYLKLTAIY